MRCNIDAVSCLSVCLPVRLWYAKAHYSLFWGSVLHYPYSSLSLCQNVELLFDTADLGLVNFFCDDDDHKINSQLPFSWRWPSKRRQKSNRWQCMFNVQCHLKVTVAWVFLTLIWLISSMAPIVDAVRWLASMRRVTWLPSELRRTPSPGMHATYPFAGGAMHTHVTDDDDMTYHIDSLVIFARRQHYNKPRLVLSERFYSRRWHSRWWRRRRWSWRRQGERREQRRLGCSRACVRMSGKTGWRWRLSHQLQ